MPSKQKLGTILKIYLMGGQLKFILSEKATKFCEIFTLLLTSVHTVKSKVKIPQNFMTFSEYMIWTLEISEIPDFVHKREK